MPQTGERNGCAQVIAGQPMNCFGAQIGALRLGTPQFATDQTYVGLVRVRPHDRVLIGNTGGATLIVALDGGATRSGESGKTSSLRAGDFVWLDKGKAGEAFLNASTTEVRFVCFGLAPADGASRSRK